MRYSYRWEVSAEALSQFHAEGGLNGAKCARSFSERYARLSGCTILEEPPSLTSASPYFRAWTCYLRQGHGQFLLAVTTSPGVAPHNAMYLEGRFLFLPDIVNLCFDFTASRWHGASITGLVVGAMGVFVFTLYLRTWLKERSVRLEEAGA
jgi:hypothetical protein